MAAVMAPGLQVIGDEHRIESGLLGVDREVGELDRAELLRGCLVAQAQWHDGPPPVRCIPVPPVRSLVARINYPCADEPINTGPIRNKQADLIRVVVLHPRGPSEVV
jgi:hypothetical protein